MDPYGPLPGFPRPGFSQFEEFAGLLVSEFCRQPQRYQVDM
jgi:hypothetical protein